MSNLINKYQNLRNEIIKRAIHINNMLHDLELPDELDSYRPTYCGVQTEGLCNSIITDYSVNLIYPDPYEDYEETWIVTASYIDMEDVDIVSDFIKRIDVQYIRDKQHMVDSLKRDAEYYGYELVKKGER